MKRRYKKLEDIPEGLADSYKKVGDSYVLDLDDDDNEDDGNDRLKEFRKTNIALKKELTEMKERYASIDPEKYAAAQEALEHVRNAEERELLRAGKYDEVISRRVEATRTQYETQVAKLKTDFEAAQKNNAVFRTELKQSKIEAGIRRAADELKVKILPTAAIDVYRRGYDVFDLDESGRRTVALDDEGQPRMNKDRKGYTERDFILDLIETAPHCVESAQGTDVNGNPRRRTGGFASLDVDRNDPKAFGSRIDDIASGKVDVTLR